MLVSRPDWLREQNSGLGLSLNTKRFGSASRPGCWFRLQSRGHNFGLGSSRGKIMVSVLVQDSNVWSRLTSLVIPRSVDDRAPSFACVVAINEHDHAVLHHHADRAARLLHTEQLRREGVDDDWRRRCHGNQVRERKVSMARIHPQEGALLGE